MESEETKRRKASQHICQFLVSLVKMIYKKKKQFSVVRSNVNKSDRRTSTVNTNSLAQSQASYSAKRRKLQENGRASVDCEWSLILAMAIVRRAKYTRARAKCRGDATRGSVCVFRPPLNRHRQY